MNDKKAAFCPLPTEPPPYLPAFILERSLGDPGLAANTPFVRRCGADPTAAHALLQGLGVPRTFLPAEPGRPGFIAGEASMALCRVLVRRDTAAAMGYIAGLDVDAALDFVAGPGRDDTQAVPLQPVVRRILEACWEGRDRRDESPGLRLLRAHGAALCLGLADTALRAAAAHVASDCFDERLRPYAHEVLAGAYLSQLTAEGLAISAARSVHLATVASSTWAGVAQARVGQLTDQAIRRLSVLLGQEVQFREGREGKLFLNLHGDSGAASLLGGPPVVCLEGLADSLPALLQGSLRRGGEVQASQARALFDLRSPVPGAPSAPPRLEDHGDLVIDSLPGLRVVLQQAALEAPGGPCRPQTWQALLRGAAALESQLAELTRDVMGQGPGDVTPAVQAERYIDLHGAVCALGLWLYNRSSPGSGGFFAAGQWLQAVLARAGGHAGLGPMDADLVTALHTHFQEQVRGGRMFSLLDWPLAAAGSVATTESVRVVEDRVF